MLCHLDQHVEIFQFPGRMYFSLFSYVVSWAFMGGAIEWQWTANLKRRERSGRGLIWGTILALSQEDYGKLQKNENNSARLVVDILTLNHRNHK